MRRPLPGPPLRARLGLIAALLLTGGCDNPFCVYGPDGCQDDAVGGGAGIGTLPASVPSDGDIIRDGAPVVQTVYPQGTAGTPRSVVVLVLSESVDPESLLGAFELVNPAFGGVYPILQPPVLAAGGRVVVLIPANPFQAGQSVLVRLTEDAAVADLTGQALSVTSESIADFSVSAAPAIPAVVTTIPRDGAQNESPFTPIVVVFDREMDPATVTGASFDVQVNQGAPPVDPAPQRLSLPGAFPIPVNQVWTWRAVDGAGSPVSLGTSANVDLFLSPTGNKISDLQENEPLPARTIGFGTASIGAPLSVTKATAALPADAIGRPNLTSGQPVLRVQLASPAQSGDDLTLFLIGEGTIPRALQRRITIPAGASTVDVTGAQLDLLTSGGLGRFLDGDLYVAARHGRGSLQSSVRVLDADPDLPGTQPLLFDVTAPNLLGFGAGGSSSFTFRSDTRGIVIAGRANEEIGAAVVTTATLGDTGARSDVVASGPEGTFVARPVSNPTPLDVIAVTDLPQPFSIRLFDRAGNGSASVSGSFVQTGVVGGGDPLPGPRVLVDVFDASTLAPIAGALVMTQQDNAGTVTNRSSVPTGTDGHAEPLSAVTGETIVIVNAPGYDLFTFHGPTRQRLQVPLSLSTQPGAIATGSVVGGPGANFSQNSTLVADSRRSPALERFVPTQSCTGDVQFGLTCDFGPITVLPRRLGAQAFGAANFDLTLGTFSASAFLRAFALRFPAPTITPGQSDVGLLTVPDLLTNLPPEQQAIAIDMRSLSLADALNLGALQGTPRVSIEGVAPGFPSSVPVGLGLALDDGGGGFDVLGAYPGVVDGIENPPGVDLPGELIERGAIEADLLVRAELVDVAGNRVGRRRRLSLGTAAMRPPDVCSLLVPGAGGSSGVLPYDLALRNVIRDASGQGGLYHVVLTDQQGRDWHLWRPDPPDAAGDVRVHVSNLASFGSSGLANGSIVASVSAHAWSGFDTDEFLWTDIDRIQDQFSRAGSVTFTQP